MSADFPKTFHTGAMRSSKGNKTAGIGYTLHTDIADGDIPISIALTLARIHDRK
jgi:hypothetical protein